MFSMTLKDTIKKQGFHFQIKIETAPNLNKTKIHIFAFLLNSRYFKFQINTNSLTFWQNAFFIENYFSMFFSVNGGQARPRLRGPGRARTPIHRKKNSFWKVIFNEKNVFAKSQGTYVGSSWFEIPNVSNSAKKQKLKSCVCSNWEQFQF